MFGRKAAAPAPAPATLEERKGAALADLQVAEAELKLAQENLDNFTRNNFRVVSGGLIYFSAENRDVLDKEFAALCAAHDHAAQNFQKKLHTWSQFTPKEVNKMAFDSLECPACRCVAARPFADGFKCIQCAHFFHPQPVVPAGGGFVVRQARVCPSCGSSAVGRIPGCGWRCNQCAHQFQS